MEFINQYVLPHWPFVAAMLIFMMIGQVVKTAVFTKTAHYKNKPVWFWWWGRKTLAVQPVLAGMILGLIWRNPENGVDTLVESCAYFAMAGCLSVWAFENLKNFAKKEGYDIELPGLDESIAPPPLKPGA